MTRRLIGTCLFALLLLPASANAAWQHGAGKAGARTDICSVPKGNLTVIKFRVDARKARSDFYGDGAQGGIWRVKAGKTVYEYDNVLVAARGKVSGVHQIRVSRTATIEPWVGNRVNPLDQRRVKAAAVTAC